jgi:hypothetical protein
VSLWERLKSWRGKKTPEPEERLLRPSEVARRLGVADPEQEIRALQRQRALTAEPFEVLGEL